MGKQFWGRPKPCIGVIFGGYGAYVYPSFFGVGMPHPSL